MPQRSASLPTVSTDGEEDDKYFDASSLASSRRPLLANPTPGSTVRSTVSKGRPGAHRHRTDPLPLSSLFSPLGAQDVAEADESLPTSVTVESLRAQKSIPDSGRAGGSGSTVSTLPRAVVVSGLEHASAPSQRALMRVLAERRVVLGRLENSDTDLSGEDADVEEGTWNLPDGFLLVYVCKWDPHERPPILGGLVDKFSMSADVSLPPSVRQSYLAYRAAHTPTPRGTPIPSPSTLPHTAHPYFASPTPVHPSPARRPAPLPAPTPQAPPVLQAPELAHLRMLARPYPTAAPIFYPSVNATHEYPSVHPTAPEPFPYAALHPSLEQYLLDLFAATRHHPALDGTLLTMRAHADAEALARAFRVLNGDTIGAALVEHEARIGGHPRGHSHDHDTAGSWRSASAAWRSAESVAGKGKGSEEYSIGGVRLRVEAEDMEGSGPLGMYDALLAQLMPELTPADAQAEAMKRSWPEIWDVSEEDVARIFPRVVSHRLRVRDGPDDEVLGSVMFPAVPPGMGAAGSDVGKGAKLGWERKSVKEILVRILADV
ncbi:hypothetical protein BD311DRAFT_776002 [Dichomitus squalens]|uniref:Uncharacterized protein n=1 Tax=Dichomitus squalens TaxID=114155 RepID=A0A4Q9MVI5_9APHY|nr:hypothetical protein BD311DRAFT_776002 [Dichomitus squalens]